MYDDAAIAAQVRATISPFTTDDALPVTRVYPAIEHAVPELVAEAVEIRVAQTARAAHISYVEAPDGIFIVAGVPHQVNVAAHTTQFSTLVVTVAAISPGASTLVRRSTSTIVQTIGRFQKIQLYTSGVLLPAKDHILAAAAVALRTAYECLLEYTAKRLATLRNQTASVMYAALRRNLAAELADNVWLYAFADGQGFYIPDDQARGVAAARLQRRRLTTTRSPGILLTDFVTHVLPLERTFSREAIKEGKPVTGVFAAAPYADEGVGVTEEAVYDARALITQPVARVNDAIVVAGYPISLASEIQPTVTNVAPHLQLALEESTSALHSHLSDLRALAAGKETSETGSWLDAFELKPNLFGLGVNFNELIGRLVNERRHRKRKTA